MEKKKLNDKGFSLVELIIVIAIMAILIGVLAPQYLKFVERSRKSADRDTVDQIIRVVQIDFADPESGLDVNDTTITLTTTGGAAISGTNATNLTSVLTNAGLSTADIKLKSSKWKDTSGGAVTSVVIKFTTTGEAVTATVTANSATGTAVVDDSGNSITGKTTTTPTP